MKNEKTSVRAAYVPAEIWKLKHTNRRNERYHYTKLPDITLSRDTNSVKRGTKVNTQLQASACSMSLGMSFGARSYVLALMLLDSAT